MKLDPDITGGHLVRGFTGNAILVGAESFSRPLILTVDRIIRDWDPPAVEQLADADFAAILALEPEVILLGTGARQRFPNPNVTTTILRQGIGIEIMNTAAACRTYNILAGEYRRVAAALFVS
ncbi:hypothetical protein GPROT2_01916 [Gammaproteobacteria bacterium]|nr:Mth938-like domain-containing protein [Gammaproteobacteria bacterium]QOJ31330.1 MAG: Xcc1710-like domain-containing protein [Gammaproteobacteria bacterium]CAG0942921.1 hypothetical protein GPROT2_01916 [Gammaproteobacteria bacterium]